MNRCILGMSLALSVSLAAAPAQAQIFFKKPRPAPETPQPSVPTPQQAAAMERQKIVEAMNAAKSDPDERKRSRAIAGLESIDAKAYPEVLAALSEIASRDAQAHIRADAMSSLARIRPMSGVAAQTLEKAAEGDASWRNRVHAKTLSLRYNLTYRPNKDEPVVASTAPPASPGQAPTVTNRFPSSPANSRLPLIRDADAPGLVAPAPVLTPSDTIPNFRPVPAPAMTAPAITQTTPVLKSPASRFIPLPKLGDPKVVDVPEMVTAPSLVPEQPKSSTPPRLEIPMVVRPEAKKPGEPEIIIPLLPNEPTVIVPAPMRPAPPGVPAIPAAPIETGPVLAPLPGIPPMSVPTVPPVSAPPIQSPMPTPSAPASPVQPMPGDDVVLPPKF
ncbi:MAG: hypothetical protein U0744_03685 [Gemmataceae bacterium]